MAEFFNKKEEFLEVQLTEYGKYLLSMGRLKPKYYSFYDEEILYNAKYIQTGSTANFIEEEQNTIDRRIRYETPNLKVIPIRTGAETRVARFMAQVEGALGGNDPADKVEAFQVPAFVESVNLSSYPLGTSALNSTKTAAWQVSVLGENTARLDVPVQEYMIVNPSSSFADINNGVIVNIPQLNFDVNYQTYFQQGAFSTDAISGYLASGDGNIYLSLNKKYLMLEIIEENTDFVKHNYEIEVFYVAHTPATSTETENTTLQAMAVVSDTEVGAGNALPTFRPLGNPETNVGDVQYYFNLYLDDEIPSNILNEVGLSSREIASNTTRLKFSRDLYTVLDDEEAC